MPVMQVLSTLLAAATLMGQRIEEDSSGWRWNDPEYFDGNEATV